MLGQGNALAKGCSAVDEFMRKSNELGFWSFPGYYREMPTKKTTEIVDLNWTISQCLQDAAERLTQGSVQVDLDLNLQIPKLSATRETLSQVFDSLLNYSSAAFDRLGDSRQRRIQIITRVHEDDALEVIYTDNAGGIPERIRQHLTQPMHPTELDQGSSGVWIKQVARIISDHRGTIDLETQDGSGSTFTLRFPLPSNS